MALVDRLAHDDEVAPIANHAFSAAVWFWAKEDITRQNVIDAFGLTASDETQLDELKAHYQGMSVDDRRVFHSDLEAAGVLLEAGLIPKAKYKNLLGLP
ncbi:MAG: hypothetical protein ACYTAO_03530 [Planctomycetota bacterium]|jgi:hypothetical protein